jgi:hypothetical protein
MLWWRMWCLTNCEGRLAIYGPMIYKAGARPRTYSAFDAGKSITRASGALEIEIFWGPVKSLRAVIGEWHLGPKKVEPRV